MVREKISNISLGTVYRNLELLEKNGLIKTLSFKGKARKFDGNLHPHDHIRCVECGHVADIPPQHLTLNAESTENFAGFKVLSYNLEILGICPECNRNNKQSEVKMTEAKQLNLDDEHRAILSALKQVDKPIGNKDLEGPTGLSTSKLSKKMKDLREGGLVDSPVRCKYVITESGRKK